MKADLLNRILKLWSSESEVLESTNDGPVEGSSEAGEPSVAESLAFVSTGVAAGLQLSIPARSRSS